MGSPDSETCPLGLTGIEHPQHRVWISYPLAVGKYPVTHDEYAAFVAATGHPDADACYSATAADSALFDEVAGRNWHDSGFNQTGRDPVVCVDWDDAQAYVQWMSNRTGHTYRLLSEAEYEYAARAGTKTAYYWGNEIGRGHANCDGCAGTWGNKQTSPVGSFSPNAFGLYDMLGNVWEWTQDCYNPDYTGAPTDGSAWQNGYFWQSGNCGRRIRRGGAWFGDPEILRSASRSDASTSERGVNVGFRIARTN